MTDTKSPRMKESVERRLQELQQEFASGQKMLVELDAKRADLQQTLLRISGAIQVLEELVAGAEKPQTEKVVDLNGASLIEHPA